MRLLISVAVMTGVRIPRDRVIDKVRRVLAQEGPAPLAYRAAQLVLRDPWGHTEWFDVFETSTEDHDERPVEPRSGPHRPTRPTWRPCRA